MGWIFPIIFGSLSLVTLQRSGRCSRAALELALAAILLALAGYAWQGHPAQQGSEVQRAISW
jgi:predicted acyltransferase